MQPSLVQRLRDSVTQCRALDRSQLLEEAAAEIERLQGYRDEAEAEAAIASLAAERLRLTDAERAAISDAADRYASITPESAETAATLRGLLERMM